MGSSRDGHLVGRLPTVVRPPLTNCHHNLYASGQRLRRHPVCVPSSRWRPPTAARHVGRAYPPTIGWKRGRWASTPTLHGYTAVHGATPSARAVAPTLCEVRQPPRSAPSSPGGGAPSLHEVLAPLHEV